MAVERLRPMQQPQIDVVKVEIRQALFDGLFLLAGVVPSAQQVSRVYWIP